MTPEAQRIAIAETCGFKWYRWGHASNAMLFLCETSKWNDLGSFVPSSRKPNEEYRSDSLPDYLNDLNAMHAAENGLNTIQRMDYAGWIFHLAGAPNIPDRTWDEIFDACHVGAGIKAEAFLRTLHKWDDGK